jgi:hypothetical protein
MLVFGRSILYYSGGETPEAEAQICHKTQKELNKLEKIQPESLL